MGTKIVVPKGHETVVEGLDALHPLRTLKDWGVACHVVAWMVAVGHDTSPVR